MNSTQWFNLNNTLVSNLEKLMLIPKMPKGLSSMGQQSRPSPLLRYFCFKQVPVYRQTLLPQVSFCLYLHIYFSPWQKLSYPLERNIFQILEVICLVRNHLSIVIFGIRLFLSFSILTSKSLKNKCVSARLKIISSIRSPRVTAMGGSWNENTQGMR